MPRWFAATMLGGLAAAACVSPEPYVCAIDADCTRDGVPGRCLDDGTCSGGAGALSGDECFVGTALAAADSTCTATVCAAAPWCCEASWGPTCVSAAEVACGAACGARVAFARERLTNSDHTQLLEDGSVEVWDFTAGSPLAATAVPTGISGLFAYDTVVWADVDRDQAAELLVTTWDGYVGGDHQWLYRPAGAAWQVVVDLMAVGVAPNNVIDAAFGDYDGDGFLDLATVGDSAVATFHGVDTGERFAAGRVVPELPDVDPLTASITAGDVDGDGDDDFVYLDYIHDYGRLIRSDPDSFFIGPSFAAASTVSNTRFGDVDGDQDLDLLVSDAAGALVLTNDGDGAFTPLWNYPPGARTPAMWSTAIWIDVDGDRDLDVALGADEGGGVVVLENQGGGVLGATPLWQSPASEASDVFALAAGDVDGDGDLDLAVAAGDGYPSRIWLNDGDRTFSLGWTDSGPRRHKGVAMTPTP